MTAIGRLHHLAYDTSDPMRSAWFWSRLLDQPITYASSDWIVVAPSVEHSGLAFRLVPDHRPPVWGDPTRPHQAHHDVMVDDVAAAEPLVAALGAHRLSAEADSAGTSIWADPAGHPFCLIRRPGWAPPVSGA